MNKHIILGMIELEKPTIAMVNGDAVGGGFELALCCDLAVASEQARFGIGFTRVGLTPAQGAAWLLPRIIGLRRAFEFITLADFWSAEDAYRMGLVNRVVPADKLEDETVAVARRLAEGPPIGLRLSKLQMYQGLNTDLERALIFARASARIAYTSGDHFEGVEAFAQKRKPVFKDQ